MPLSNFDIVSPRPPVLSVNMYRLFFARVVATYRMFRLSTIWYSSSSLYSLRYIEFSISFCLFMGSRLNILNGAWPGSHHKVSLDLPVSSQSQKGIMIVGNSNPFDLCIVITVTLSLVAAGMVSLHSFSSHISRKPFMSVLLPFVHCEAWSRNEKR